MVVKSSLKKRHKPRKQFWNPELELLFDQMVTAERVMRKCTLRYLKRDLRFQFKDARHRFDKSYRRAERQYKRGQMLDLEDLCTKNPKEFWAHLKKLGPRRADTIPMEVYNDSHEIVCDSESVLNKWKDSFSELYNTSNFKMEENEARQLKTNIMFSEQILLDPLYTDSEALNSDITESELKKVINSAKFKKAVGIDIIPNEILKCEKLLFRYRKNP